MKAKTISILAILLTTLTAVSQTTSIIPHINGTFCGKIGPDDPNTYITYSIEELKNCDFKISAIDTNYTVTNFKMGLVPKDDSYKYSEFEINSNSIPENIEVKYLITLEEIFLEFIKAKNIKGEEIHVKPIGVRIQ